MYTTYFSAFLKILLGPGGRYYAALGTLPHVMMYYVLRTYYRDKGYIPADRTMKGLFCGETKTSHILVAYYRGDTGYHALRDDLYRLLSSSTSIVGVRRVQDELHAWITDIGILAPVMEQYYEACNADIADIAAYTASVMHYILTA